SGEVQSPPWCEVSPAGPQNVTCVSYKHPSVRGALGDAGGAAAGAVRCPPGQCCVGIWNRSHALAAGGGRGDACPSATCAPSPAGHPGSSVLLCLCHGHLCNGNATGAAAAAGGPRPGPG
ncbi:AMHR2 protein, partial [Agelaius phoeniceus]|nr:AMHR2 protein [Agelaius phoeniceus]